MKVCPACAATFESAAWICPSCRWHAEVLDGVTHVLAGGAAVEDGFSAEQFAGLLDVESDHFWFAARNALIAWAVRRYFPNARTFLDVGSGTGQVVAALQRDLPGVQFTALEGSLPGLLAMTARAPGITGVHADARHLPFQDEFDVAGAFDVLEHIREDAQMALQLKQAVKPGGGLIVTVPQHPGLWGPIDAYSGHQRRYTRRALVDLLRSAGFRIERVTSFVSLLLPALLFSRATQPASVDPHREFRIPPIVNRIGGLVMVLERQIIRAGVPLPAGGSLLAVARR